MGAGGEVQCGELAVVYFCGVVVNAGSAGFVGEGADGSCDAVGGDFCDPASFAGAPDSGFVFLVAGLIQSSGVPA